MPSIRKALTDEEAKAFQTLNEALLNPQVLTLPRLGNNFIIYIDACDTQVSCVLLQDQSDEKDPNPIGYWSRILTAR